MEERPLLLVGYFGYGNLGDEETLRVFSERLRSRGILYRVLCGGRKKRGGYGHALPLRKAFREEECVVPHTPTLAKDKLETREGFLDTVRRGDPLALLRAIRECRGVILVGGNLLQSESSVRSLLYYAALLRYAVRLGKPILLFGGGLGGFCGGISEIVMRKLLPKFSYLGLRSEGDISSSLRFSVEKCKVHFTPDLCFSLSDGIYADSEGGCEDLKGRREDLKERHKDPKGECEDLRGRREDSEERYEDPKGEREDLRGRREDSEERYEDPKGEREDSEKMYEKAKDVVFIPRKAAASDICFWRILDAVREAGRHAVIAVFFRREDGAVLSRLATKAGASLATPRTYEEFSRIAAAAECTVCERFHGGVFSLLSHTVCYLRTTSGKCKGLYETVESLAPSGGLLVPFQSYEELLPRLQKLLGTGETRNRTRDENPLARGKTIKNESAPAVPVTATSRADDAEGKSARAGRSEREPAPAITSENNPCPAERRKNATDPPTEAVSTKRSESAPTFTEGGGANEKRKKEIGDKASDFSRVISLLRDKEEEEFTLFLREFSGG